MKKYWIQCLFLYFLFCIIGAGRLFIIENSDWKTYYTIRVICLILLLFSILSGRSSLQELSLKTQQKLSKLECGDPLLLFRSFACLFVILQHSFIAFPPNNLSETIMQNAKWLLIPSAWAGVWMFFVLSGYLIGKGFFTGRYKMNPSGIIAFYKNRLLKIAPLYFITVIVVSALLYPEIYAKENLWNFFSILFFEYDGTLPINPNGSLWSIATEMQFYLGAPFLAILAHKLLHNKSKRFFMIAWTLLILFEVIFREKFWKVVDG